MRFKCYMDLQLLVMFIKACTRITAHHCELVNDNCNLCNCLQWIATEIVMEHAYIALPFSRNDQPNEGVNGHYLKRIILIVISTLFKIYYKPIAPKWPIRMRLFEIANTVDQIVWLQINHDHHKLLFIWNLVDKLYALIGIKHETGMWVGIFSSVKHLISK